MTEIRTTLAEERPEPQPAGVGGRGTRKGPLGRLSDWLSSRPGAMALYYRQVVAELRKVIWPTRKELITYTTVVIFFVAVVTSIVAVLDILFAKGVLKIFG